MHTMNPFHRIALTIVAAAVTLGASPAHAQYDSRRAGPLTIRLQDEFETPLQAIQRLECETKGGLTVEGYWIGFEAEGLAQPNRTALILTDPCGFHTFYDFDKDADDEPVLVPVRYGAREKRAAYRPITGKSRWLEVWLEKVAVLESAEDAMARIDWDAWRSVARDRRLAEAEMVRAALEEDRVSFSLAILDTTSLVEDRDGDAVRWLHQSNARYRDDLTVEFIEEALRHQRTLLGRAWAQNATHLPVDTLSGELDGEPLPVLGAGGYLHAMRCHLCACPSGATDGCRWYVAGPDALPVPWR
jgi:hypothetical protein